MQAASFTSPAKPGKRGKTSQLLRQMELPRQGGPRLFVLGCMERRRVTMGSQQIRAINLVHAIATEHFEQWSNDPKRPSTSKYRGWELEAGEAPKLLVVGGSAGGMTAAAYAAFRGAKVTLFEMKGELMPNLKDSDRLLHPRLYEWGSPQPFMKDRSNNYWAGDKVGLPLLDWNAGCAHKVRDELIKEWKSWEELYDINVKLNCTVHNLHDLGGEFDHVILAVGFGVEQCLPNTKWPDWINEATGSYWQRDELQQREGNFLICGNGDGALTDLFRVCINGFTQETVSQIIKLAETLEHKVISIEKKLGKSKPIGKVDKPALAL